MKKNSAFIFLGRDKNDCRYGIDSGLCKAGFTLLVKSAVFAIHPLLGFLNHF
jgi:hypothetical protein